MADVTIPTPAAQDQSAVASAQLQPPPPPTAGTQATDPGGSSFEPQQDTATQFNTQFLEPYLQKYVQSFRTSAGRDQAQSQADQLRVHMFQKQSADMASIAGHQAITDTESNLNSLATLAREDPTSTDIALQMYGSHLDATVKQAPNLTPEQAASIHQEYQTKGQQTIAMAHYYGLATRTPLVALDELKAGKYAQFLPEGAAQAIQAHATSMLHAQASDMRAQQAQLKKDQEDRFQSTLSGYYANAVQPDGTYRFPQSFQQDMVTLSQMPGRDLGAITALAAARRSQVEQQINRTFVQSDPHVLADRMARAHIPAGQPGALTDTEVWTDLGNNRLSVADAGLVNKARADAVSDPSDGVARGQINKLITDAKLSITRTDPAGKIVDFAGDQRYGYFQSDIWKEYDAAKASGKSPAEIARDFGDGNNPHNLMVQAMRYRLTSDQNDQYLAHYSDRTGPPVVPGINNPDLQFYAGAKNAPTHPPLPASVAARNAAAKATPSVSDAAKQQAIQHAASMGRPGVL